MFLNHMDGENVGITPTRCLDASQDFYGYISTLTNKTH
jgi:hypothetical protein